MTKKSNPVPDPEPATVDVGSGGSVPSSSPKVVPSSVVDIPLPKMGDMVLFAWEWTPRGPSSPEREPSLAFRPALVVACHTTTNGPELELSVALGLGPEDAELALRISKDRGGANLVSATHVVVTGVRSAQEPEDWCWGPR